MNLNSIFNDSGQVVQTPLPNKVQVDRYQLSKTWYELLQKLAGRHPTQIERWAIDYAYSKIVERMQQLGDDELMQDINDILDAIDIARLSLPGLEKKGYYKGDKK